MSADRSTSWMNVEQAAAHLGVTSNWLYERVASKAIPHHRVGRFVRFTPEDLQRIERSTQVEPTDTRRRLRSTA